MTDIKARLRAEPLEDIHGSPIYAKELMEEAAAAIEALEGERESVFERFRVALRERDEARQLHNIERDTLRAQLAQRDADIATLKDDVLVGAVYYRNAPEMEAMQAERDTLKAENARLREALTKVRDITKSDAFKGPFIVAQVHGAPYTGEQFPDLDRALTPEGQE